MAVEAETHTRESISFLLYRAAYDGNVPGIYFPADTAAAVRIHQGRFPEIYAEIKNVWKKGRWEVDGGMWVEADCNLTSGESLTRQILIGSKIYQG